jgi:hypothetical protein
VNWLERSTSPWRRGDGHVRLDVHPHHAAAQRSCCQGLATPSSSPTTGLSWGGVGWNDVEYEAVGVHKSGAASDRRMLDIMMPLLGASEPYHGQFYDVDDVFISAHGAAPPARTAGP